MPMEQPINLHRLKSSSHLDLPIDSMSFVHFEAESTLLVPFLKPF